MDSLANITLEIDKEEVTWLNLTARSEYQLLVKLSNHLSNFKRILYAFAYSYLPREFFSFLQLNNFICLTDFRARNHVLANDQ